MKSEIDLSKDDSLSSCVIETWLWGIVAERIAGSWEVQEGLVKSC
jgi:hypothetical protein